MSLDDRFCLVVVFGGPLSSPHARVSLPQSRYRAKRGSLQVKNLQGTSGAIAVAVR